MRKIPSLLSIVKKELFTFHALTFLFGFAFLYVIFSLFVLNHQLILDTILIPSPLFYKVTLFATLFAGLFTAFSPLDTTIFLLSSVLVGVNFVLIGKTVYKLESQGKVRLSVGGATLISLVTTGCSSCGFSLLSVLGLGTSLSFLPFHGMELHIASVLLLLISSWYMVKKLRDGLYCKIK